MSIKVNVMGRVTREVEVKQTAKGNDVARIGIVSNLWNGKEEVPTYIDFDVYGTEAIERVVKNLKKGNAVNISGRNLRTYINKSGDKVGLSAIFVDFERLLSSGNGATGEGTARAASEAKSSKSGFSGGRKAAPKPESDKLEWDESKAAPEEDDDNPF